MLLTRREEEGVLIAGALAHSLRLLLLHHVDRNLLPKEALLRTQLSLFIVHGVLAIGSKCLTAAWVCLVKSIVFPHLVKLELVRDGLTDHVFELVGVSQVYAVVLRVVAAADFAIGCVDDDWHDDGLGLPCHGSFVRWASLLSPQSLARHRLFEPYQASFVDLDRGCCHIGLRRSTALTFRGVMNRPLASARRAAQADVALFEILPVVSDLIENLVDLIDYQVFANLVLHASCEAFLAHRHGSLGVPGVHLLHDHISDGVKHLRFRHALPSAHDGFYGLARVFCRPHTGSLLVFRVNCGSGAADTSHNLRILLV